MENKPIHVLQVTTRLGTGGVQSFLVNYAEHVDNQKVVFDVVVQSSEPQRYDDIIRKMGGKIFYVKPMTTSPIGFFLDLYKICKEQQNIKVIHSHLNYRNFIPLLAAKYAGVSVRISHSHSAYEAKSKMKKVARLIYQALLPFFATQYWGCSEKANQWLYGKNRKNTVVVHNAIDSVSYRFNCNIRKNERAKLGFSDDDIAIVHVGTFGEAKNHLFIFSLFKEYLRKHPKAYLILCGDGPKREKFEREIDKMQLKEHVKMLGMVDNIQDILSAADVFILPSLYEGLPLSAVEAQTSGVACVVSDAVPKEAIFGSNSLICKEFNIENWIKSIDDMRAMSVNREDAYKLTKKAGYDIDTEARKLEDRYIKLC